tara:strand:+ start:30 stop:575 length:546 start_codon:yes stop_codon:yes gene_type:complete
MNISNFIEKYKVSFSTCDGLINYFKKNKEYKLPGCTLNKFDKNFKKSTDVVFINSSKDKKIKDFFKELNKSIQNYSHKYKLQESVKTAELNNIQYYKPNEGYPALHYERSYTKPHRQLAYMLYLNTVTDRGGTKFIFQNLTLSAIKGDLYIWPADFTHVHQGIVSKTQEKYIVTGWFEIVL